MFDAKSLILNPAFIYYTYIYIFFSLPKEACLTSYMKAKMSEVEDEISEALKHAPKRKGGSKYKVSSEFN